MAHYNLEPTTNNLGIAHENGDVEQEHYRFKEAVDQALRNGLALVAAGGIREKLGKAHYPRAKPARDALARWVDATFFDELWARATLTSVDDLRQIKGIGEKTLEKNRDRISTAAAH